MTIQKNLSTSVVIDGRSYLYFGGTNYLGLAQRKELMIAASAAFHEYGFSSGAGRLTSGETEILLDLERELARFARAEAALTLPAGYVSNFAVVDALEDVIDAWVVQGHAHGSIRSAISQSKRPVLTVADNMRRQDLRTELAVDKKLRVGVFVEPINPLTGKYTAVEEFLSGLHDEDFLVVDEAHSLGVLGSGGSGIIGGLPQQTSATIVRTGTLSKALGTQGGFVLGSSAVISRVKTRSNAYKASTPLSPVLCAAALKSIELIEHDPDSPVEKLRANIRKMNSELVALGYEQYNSNSVPIYSIAPVDSNIRERLLKNEIYVPSVSGYFAQSENVALRWTLQAAHSDEELATFTRVLQNLLKESS